MASPLPTHQAGASFDIFNMLSIPTRVKRFRAPSANLAREVPRRTPGSCRHRREVTIGSILDGGNVALASSEATDVDALAGAVLPQPPQIQASSVGNSGVSSLPAGPEQRTSECRHKNRLIEAGIFSNSPAQKPICTSGPRTTSSHTP